jgi:predicted AAA+ superfamily ATPase
MAKTARQFVSDGLELIPDALSPWVETRLSASLTGHWQAQVTDRIRGLSVKGGNIHWDQQALFRVMDIFWNDAFREVLGRTDRAMVNELVEVRNKWAHNEPFSYDDAERALDTMRRLMDSISAGGASDKLTNLRNAVLRVKFEEMRRSAERRKTQQADMELETVAGLKPWREVITPHNDVASGDFNQAEFAADLSKVHNGTAPTEYSDPKAFFSRTYLTGGLQNLLLNAARRLSGAGGEPVVELQTNFGGGKTHSLLALYHMVGGMSADELLGLDQLLGEAGLEVPKQVNRAVLVGTSRGPQDVKTVEDGTEIRTTWGDLAWQLGGKEAFDMVAEQDKSGVAPGSELLEKLFTTYSPCLILIDEWVAYLRNIYGVDGLPSGSFDANLSFVQALTEAVKPVEGALLVASLPAAQSEAGGSGGQEALTRLKQTFSRVESPWLPASQEESYEIVRRRLFQEIDGSLGHHKDNTVKQFMKLYRETQDSFPQVASSSDYERKMAKSYPIHPELFDQLYQTWSSIENFQRTRGILRLMAQVVHELWASSDKSVLIMPSNVNMVSPRVQPELTKYLGSEWSAILANDIDGEQSIPYQVDNSQPNLGKVHASRRVARSLFMGTAPLSSTSGSGMEDKQIYLGIVQPGEKPNLFGDALRRLQNRSTYMHSELGRHWYSTAPSLNRIASEKAEQLEEALVDAAIDDRLKKYITSVGDRSGFDAVHCSPGTSSDVPDDAGNLRLVVLGVKNHHQNSRPNSEGMAEAKNILTYRGSAQRVYRNTLVFLAADSRAIDGVREEMRREMAWEQIVRETDRLNLTQSDAARAKEQMNNAVSTVDVRMREAWSQIIYPIQRTPQDDVEFSSSKLQTTDQVFAKIIRKLEVDQVIYSELGPRSLNRVLERGIWPANGVLKLSDLADYHARFIYMPRLVDTAILKKTVSAAISQTVPGEFAYAEMFDAKAEEFSGLTIENGMNMAVSINSDSLIVRPDIAEKFRSIAPEVDDHSNADDHGNGSRGNDVDAEINELGNDLPKRYRGTVGVSTERPSRDFGRIVENIVEHLILIEGANVEITVEIEADVPGGIEKGKQRVLLENSNTLRFKEVKLD